MGARRCLAESAWLAPRQAGRAQTEFAAQGMPVAPEGRGAEGGWHDALNGGLQPNTVYVLANGRSDVTDAAGWVGGEGYDGGHLIATLFGGAGERINLVPQLASVNRGEFREMEKIRAEALRAGKSVKVEVSPVYAGASKVPSEIDVVFSIDGVAHVRSFANASGG